MEPYKILVNYVNGTPSQTVQDLVNTSTAILEDIIAQSHGHRSEAVSATHDMVVDVDISPLAEGVLASARPTMADVSTNPAFPLRQYVTLNSNRFNETGLFAPVLFNHTMTPKMVPVMVHEMLHGLGIASINTPYAAVGWNQFLDEGKTWYVGPAGDWTKSAAIAAYREVVGSHVQRVPVENSFGQGTAYSHWEEGLKEGFASEKRYYDYGAGPVFHPALPEEISTGVAGVTFYFTKMTAGALEDHGYVINKDSSHIAAYPAGLIQTA